MASKRDTPLDPLSDFDALPDAAHVRQPVVQTLWGCSAATLWRRIKDGTIPQPRRFPPRSNAWNVGELRRALRSVEARP